MSSRASAAYINLSYICKIRRYTLFVRACLALPQRPVTSLGLECMHACPVHIDACRPARKLNRTCMFTIKVITCLLQRLLAGAARYEERYTRVRCCPMPVLWVFCSIARAVLLLNANDGQPRHVRFRASVRVWTMEHVLIDGQTMISSAVRLFVC